MRQRLRNTSLLMGLSVLWFPAGCAHRDVLSEKLQAIENLRFERDEYAQKLEDARRSQGAYSEQLRRLLCEKDRLTAELAALEAAAGAANDEVEVLEKERGALADRLSLQTLELRELKTDRDRLAGRAEGLEEIRSSARQQADVIADLQRRILASEHLHGDPSSARQLDFPPPGIDADELSPATLKHLRQVKDHYERLIGKAQEESGTMAAAEFSRQRPERAGESGYDLYREDGAGLWKELAGLFRDRVLRMAERKARWDSTDLAVIGCLGGLALVLFLLARLPFRWLQARARRREIRRLKQRICELEANPALSPGGPRLAVRALSVPIAGADLEESREAIHEDEPEADSSAEELAAATEHDQASPATETPMPDGESGDEAESTSTQVDSAQRDEASDVEEAVDLRELGSSNSASVEEEREAASLEDSNQKRGSPSIVAPVQVVVGGRLASRAPKDEAVTGVNLETSGAGGSGDSRSAHPEVGNVARGPRSHKQQRSEEPRQRDEIADVPLRAEIPRRTVRAPSEEDQAIRTQRRVTRRTWRILGTEPPGSGSADGEVDESSLLEEPSSRTQPIAAVEEVEELLSIADELPEQRSLVSLEPSAEASASDAPLSGTQPIAAVEYAGEDERDKKRESAALVVMEPLDSAGDGDEPLSGTQPIAAVEYVREDDASRGDAPPLPLESNEPEPEPEPVDEPSGDEERSSDSSPAGGEQVSKTVVLGGDVVFEARAEDLATEEPEPRTEANDREAEPATSPARGTEILRRPESLGEPEGATEDEVQSRTVEIEAPLGLDDPSAAGAGPEAGSSGPLESGTESRWPVRKETEIISERPSVSAYVDAERVTESADRETDIAAQSVDPLPMFPVAVGADAELDPRRAEILGELKQLIGARFAPLGQ